MAGCSHGGDIYSRKIEYDFSANINPLGMPEAVKSAIISGIASFEAYPDINCTKLVKKISEHENISEKYIYCGNGAADLIYRIVYTLKPKTALVTAPTFSEYENSLLNVNCRVNYEQLYETNDFKLTESIVSKISKSDIIFICNPNNPTGKIVESDLLKLIIKKCQDLNKYIVIDECFIDFIIDSEKYSAKKYLSENVIIIKAFTKIFAMAGIRLGYLLAKNQALIDKIRKEGQCWNVSTVSQIAGAAAFSDKSYITSSQKYILNERLFLESKLKQLGFKVFTSEVNFILFKCHFNLEKKLLKYKIAIRNCSNYRGLEEGFFRIAVRTHEENLILIETIERIVNNG